MKKRLHTILLPVFFLLLYNCQAQLHPQSFFFRHYQVENGLANNTVFSSVQDKDGFLWFGTKDGLSRFDGYHFKHFTISDDGHNMTPDIISALQVTKDNMLLVGCQKGLYRFDREKERMVKMIDTLEWINCMHIDIHGDLWFTSAVMLCRYNFKTQALQTFPTDKYFAVTSICSATNGDIWAATPDGFIQHFDSATQRFTGYNMFTHSAPATSNWIQKIHSAGSDHLFVGTSSQGLKKFDISTSTYTDILTYNPDHTTIYVRDIKRYGNNEYWFATESGIFILDTVTQQFTSLKKKFLDPYSLSDNAVYTLLKDNEGGIWAGTFFGGINYYSRQYAAFQKYFPDNSTNSISGSAVREICEDHQGNVWIGTEDAGLNKLNPVTGAITQFKPSGEKTNIAYTNIHGLLVSGNDLWIGTFDHGLDILDIPTGKVKKHFKAGPGKKELKSNFIVTMLQSKAGDIYAGTGNSLFRYDKKENGFDLESAVPPNNFISCLLEGHDNKIWVGTHGNGVFYFNPLTGETGHYLNQPDNANSITTNVINAIFEDSHKNLWFSTEGGGLCKLGKDQQSFSVYTTRNGLPSNFVFKTLEDNKHTLWITTSRGLVNFNPITLEKTVYTKDNGLLNDQFNYNSGFKDSTGKIYFGSVKGMITFQPEDFSKSVHTPQVYITGFQVQNKEVEINKDSSVLKQSIIGTSEITLPYDRSSFSIDFAALSFISPEMTEYSYIMKGLDKEWTSVKSNRKIYFTNLSSGKYVFKVKAGINGVWGEEKQLTIKILPPFWATTWAYLVYTCIIIALSYYLLRSYHIIIEDKKEKEIYEAKIDFFTNVAHEIRTPLTLIKGPVENLRERMHEVPDIKDDVLMMERNTNRLVALITQILDFRQTETRGFSIHFEKVNISEQLREVYANFLPLAKKRNLAYNIDLPANDIHIYADEEALTKIFNNLFSNAVKYAKQTINIRLQTPVKNGHLFMEIENDGFLVPEEMTEKIFEPFYRLKESSKQQGTGIGLALARSLTELHSGRLYLKDTGSGLNTFVLCLPVKPIQELTELNTNKRLLNIK